MHKKTTVLKNLYRRTDRILVCVSAPTPYAAKLIQAAGLEYTYCSGGVTGSAMLAMPDNGTITLSEFVAMAKAMGDAVDIPVACDVDAGFGGIFQVERTVQELIRAGLAGIRIEDQPFTGKRFGGAVGKQMVSLDEAVAKFRIAHDARVALDGDFQIVARCEALTAENSRGVDEAIERLNAYKAAGADVLHLEGPRSVGEIVAVRQSVQGPLTANFYNMPEPVSPAQAFGLGLSEARYPRLLWNAMHLAGLDALRKFVDPDARPATLDDLPDVARLDALRAKEEHYLSPAPHAISTAKTPARLRLDRQERGV